MIIIFYSDLSSSSSTASTDQCNQYLFLPTLHFSFFALVSFELWIISTRLHRSSISMLLILVFEFNFEAHIASQIKCLPYSPPLHANDSSTLQDWSGLGGLLVTRILFHFFSISTLFLWSFFCTNCQRINLRWHRFLINLVYFLCYHIYQCWNRFIEMLSSKMENHVSRYLELWCQGHWEHGVEAL